MEISQADVEKGKLHAGEFEGLDVCPGRFSRGLIGG